MSDFNRFGNMMPPAEYMRSPYKMDRHPFCIAGNLFFVGNLWTSSHLIDTGDGLILLDTPCAGGLPGLLRNIWELGYELSQLKYIVISHAHPDHYGSANALAHLSGAKVFLGRVDAEYMRTHPERMDRWNRDVGFYNESCVPDVELEDGDVVSLGNTRMRCVLTPGHTIGVMSHFWDTEIDGKTMHVGIYGGAGFVTVSEKALREENLPLSLQKSFSDSIDKVWNEPVDIMLGNHPFHNDTYQKWEKAQPGGANPFVDSAEWHRFLSDLRTRYSDFLRKTPEEVAAMYVTSQFCDYYRIPDTSKETE